MSQPKVVIVIVNYNGWPDTLECLESILQCSYSNYQIVVVDNCSTDSSLKRIVDWANGDLDVYTMPDNALRGFSCPPVQKPLPWVMMSRAEAECGCTDILQRSIPKLILVEAGDNLGFAAGTNIGIRFALSLPDLRYIWILNNDTVVDKQALIELVECTTADLYDRPGGSIIHEYDTPNKLQLYGGLKFREHAVLRPHGADMFEEVDYLVGASIMLSRNRLHDLGLLEEKFFLNSEDLAYTYFYKKAFVANHKDIPPFIVCGKIWHKGARSQSRDGFLHAYYFTRNILYSALTLSKISFMMTLLYAAIRAIMYSLMNKKDKARGIFTGMKDFFLKRFGRYNA